MTDHVIMSDIAENVRAKEIGKGNRERTLLARDILTSM